MEINGLIQWLFKWWLIASTVFWCLVGSVYFILQYVSYRLTHP